MNFSASGEAHDRRGNYVKGEISHEVGGQGNVSCSTGVKKEDKEADQ